MLFLPRKFISFFFVLAVLCWGCSKGIRQSLLVKKYSPAELRQDAEVIKPVILKMHPVIGIYNTASYYEREFNSFVMSLNDSLSEKEFRIKLKILLEDLHCGHTEAMYSKAYGKEINKLKLNYSPYLFIPVKNNVYVLTGIDKKRDTLLKKGTLILKINGYKTDTILKLCRQMITVDGYNTTGKDHYLKFGFNGFYLGVFGRPDTFNIEYLKGKEVKTVKYPAVKLKNLPAIPLLPKDDSTFVNYKRASVKYKYFDEEKKSAYLKISSFSRSYYKKAYRKIFKNFKSNQTQSLVIDLRNNGGGSLANSYKLLSYLIDTTLQQTMYSHVKNYPNKKYTKGNIWFKFMRAGFKLIGKRKSYGDTDAYTLKIKPNKSIHYNNKIFVLINGGSFSASCLVAAYLKHHNRATFIGEETSGALEGCNAGITPYYVLPNTKLKIRVPVFRVQHDIYKINTGHGIIPDYRVEYTINDIFAKKDLELQKVKELLNAK